MVYDPAWDMPQPNWVQQGSFESGSIPPVVEPTAGTQVWLGPVAQEWLPWICGALDQGRNPSSWIVADDAHMYDTLRRWDTLMGLICASGGSQNPIMLRLENCVLQSSSDGGVTWTDVSGWSAGFPGCVRSNMPPPVPVAPPGNPIQQRACDLAGYLASGFIQYTMQQMITGITGGVTKNTIVHQLIQFFPELALALDAAQTALGDFYDAITGGTLAHYQAAQSDVTLWGKVTCAIFNAIKVVGYVDATNFNQVDLNIAAIAYTYPEVINALTFYWVQLTLAGVQALQQSGAYDVVDCSSCPDVWCYEWDFTVNNGGFLAVAGHGVWTAGVGWQAQNVGGVTALYIYRPLSPAFGVTDTFVQFTCDTSAGGQARHAFGVLAAGGNTPFQNIDAGAHPTPYVQGGLVIGGVVNEVDYAINSAGAGHSIIVKKINLNGTGVNPFGANNCTIP